MDTSGNTAAPEALAALAALAQPTRLAAFRSLVRAGPEGVAAGDLARLCGVPPNTLSTHLGILSRASLIRSSREGRVIRYSADYDGFRALVGYLLLDCCGGRPEVCAPLRDALAVSFAACACEEAVTHA